MDGLDHELEQMRRVMHRVAHEVYRCFPSDAARQAFTDVIDTSDRAEIVTATLYWSKLGAAIDTEIIRSVRHHDERDQMH